MATENKNNTLVTVIIVLLIVAGAYYFFNARDQRSGGEKLGDAVDSFSKTGSIGSAGEQLKSRSPAEKLGDKIKEETK